MVPTDSSASSVRLGHPCRVNFFSFVFPASFAIPALVIVRTITNAGIAKLAGNTKLKKLTLQGCPNLTDEALLSVGTMRGLRYLDISNCLKMSDEGRRKIQKVLPDCTISL